MGIAWSYLVRIDNSKCAIDDTKKIFHDIKTIEGVECATKATQGVESAIEAIQGVKCDMEATQWAECATEATQVVECDIEATEGAECYIEATEEVESDVEEIQGVTFENFTYVDPLEGAEETMTEEDERLAQLIVEKCNLKCENASLDIKWKAANHNERDFVIKELEAFPPCILPDPDIEGGQIRVEHVYNYTTYRVTTIDLETDLDPCLATLTETQAENDLSGQSDANEDQGSEEIDAASEIDEEQCDSEEESSESDEEEPALETEQSDSMPCSETQPDNFQDLADSIAENVSSSSDEPDENVIESNDGSVENLCGILESEQVVSVDLPEQKESIMEKDSVKDYFGGSLCGDFVTPNCGSCKSYIDLQQFRSCMTIDQMNDEHQQEPPALATSLGRKTFCSVGVGVGKQSLSYSMENKNSVAE